jgi:DNA-directed RNA polymerase sigma subunit (sigma70/sigma32)
MDINDEVYCADNQRKAAPVPLAIQARQVEPTSMDEEGGSDDDKAFLSFLNSKEQLVAQRLEYKRLSNLAAAKLATLLATMDEGKENIFRKG